MWKSKNWVKVYRSFPLTVYSVSFLLFFSPHFSHAQSGAPPTKEKLTPSSSANIGFDAVVSDAEVLVLLERHGVTPEAAYMWTSGLTGTHRAYAKKNSSTFLGDARTKTIESFEKGLEGNRLRLQRFVEQHTEQDVVASEDLQTQARSLLNSRASLTAALAEATMDKPLIFSLEVTGEPLQIEQLGRDLMVKAFQPSAGVAGKMVVPHTPKPQAYQKHWTDPSVESLDAAGLYRQVSFLSGTGVK